MKEIWRAIIGYEGLYEVSNWGRVKSLPRNTTSGKILKPIKDKDGYLYVCLCKDGKVKNLRVHRLVGMAFPDLVDWATDAKGRPFEELEINHKKEGLMGKVNNHVSNLQWCDCKYNSNYGTRTERSAKTQRNDVRKSKRVAQKTKDGELVKVWSSTKEVERQTGWSSSNISACCRGRYKQAYGFIWKYV